MKTIIADFIPIIVVLILLLSLLSITEDSKLTSNVIKKLEKALPKDPTIIKPYLELLNTPNIKPFITLTSREQQLFEEKIMELETNNVQTWNKFKGKTTLTHSDIREIWLERITLTFYHEIHNTFNWKITTYNDKDLKTLLEFCTFEQLEFDCNQGFKKNNFEYEFQFVINDNPIEPFELIKEISKTYNKNLDQLQNHEQALEMIAQWMKDNNWQHASSGTLATALNYKLIGKTKKTTSHSNREFLQATLRALNIPTENVFINDKEDAVHGGIIFPTIKKGLFSTDDVMAFPNVFLPLTSSFIDETVLRRIETASRDEQCRNYGDIRKNIYIEFLQITDEEIKKKYLCALYPDKERGAFFFDKINKFYAECSNSAKKLFQDDEIQFWQEQIVCQ